MWLCLQPCVACDWLQRSSRNRQSEACFNLFNQTTTPSIAPTTRHAGKTQLLCVRVCTRVQSVEAQTSSERTAKRLYWPNWFSQFNQETERQRDRETERQTDTNASWTLYFSGCMCSRVTWAALRPSLCFVVMLCVARHFQLESFDCRHHCFSGVKVAMEIVLTELPCWQSSVHVKYSVEWLSINWPLAWWRLNAAGTRLPIPVCQSTHSGDDVIVNDRFEVSDKPDSRNCDGACKCHRRILCLSSVFVIVRRRLQLKPSAQTQHLHSETCCCAGHTLQKTSARQVPAQKTNKEQASSKRSALWMNQKLLMWLFHYKLN